MEMCWRLARSALSFVPSVRHISTQCPKDTQDGSHQHFSTSACDPLKTHRELEVRGLLWVCSYEERSWENRVYPVAAGKCAFGFGAVKGTRVVGSGQGTGLEPDQTGF